MHKYEIWPNWDASGTNKSPELYEAADVPDAVRQYVLLHLGDGLTGSFTIWLRTDNREGPPTPVKVPWLYVTAIRQWHGSK